MHRRLILSAAIVLAACSGPSGLDVAEPEAALGPGTVVEVASGRAVAQEALLERLAAADYVLLGERHGNADHHALQAEVVRQLQARGEEPRAVAFEMMGTDQQLQITEHLRAHGRDARDLGTALNWSESGWPDWPTAYGPIAQAALDGGGEIIAANLPRDQIKAVYGSGSAALRPALVERTGLAERLPEVLAVALRDDLVASHCGHAAGEMIDGMFRVQRARDAVMADRLVTASGRGGGVLIAGAQHVRTDRGVPWYVARLDPGADVVSVAFLEVDPAAGEPDLDLPFDYVWLTEAAPGGGDPCDALRKADDERDGAPARSG
ncbi:MAG TPA: ChaN family lipoprotein [Geminicoccaceae bacterium]